ncbi:unnamed protein product [Urochloa decumbens]|uniref:Protein FAR1-RELATED SEQUENCE n=1 Tax=Urochloa decumbens TaxID=240449 RepID=A0ABC9E034_9POAL
MGGKAPITLLTDQCAAMAKARRTALPNTKHRWCRWHVLKDAKKYLGHYFSKYSTFKKEFKTLVTFVTDKAEFESQWKQLQSKYQLMKNKFLNRLFKYREMWAKPYFMQDFCAGMTSTQRSESANHMIKTIIQKAAPMHLFVSKFTEFQTTRKSDECTQNFATLQVNRRLTTRLPIEGHANAVYTKTMYQHFSNQLFESGSFVFKEKRPPSEYILIDVRLEGSDIARDIHVTLEGENWITCDCGLYEHMGMLCRHAIKVLTHLDRREIPSKNILQRWTKWFDEGNNNTEYLTQLAIENDDMKKKALVSKAFELANKEATISNFTYQQAMEALTHATNCTGTTPTTTQIQNDPNRRLTGDLPTSCPPSTFKGGRPAHTGQKSWLEIVKKDKRPKGSEADKQATDWPREENPPCKKRRSISDLMKA